MSMTLHDNLDQLEPRDPASLYPNIGPNGMQLLEDIRYAEDGIADGKLAIDELQRRGVDIEVFASEGYAHGLPPAEIYGPVVPYASARPVLLGAEGESMVDFAKRLRPHQERVVRDGAHSFTLTLTCDGRYELESYPLDSWSILKGLSATGDIDKAQDLTDFYTRQILRHGYPFNGIPVMDQSGGDPSEGTNYYAGRSQPPTYFYMIRLMGEHGGDDVYAHKPYVQAMERLWEHFNPEPALLANQIRGQFHAFRRGGVSPEGLPFSVYGDDTNNGRALKDYIGRPESHAEDVETARKAAARAAREGRDPQRAYAETLVHLQAAAEWGWDMSTGRQAGGKDLSYINTTNIVPIELQCMLADAAEVLGHSYRVLRERADARGDTEAATRAYQKELYYRGSRDQRIRFINMHMWNPETGTYHDLELVDPSGPYSSLRSYQSAQQTPVISAATLNTLYSDVTDIDQSVSVMNVAKEQLLGPGGLAVTNMVTSQQWDGPNAWTTTDRIGVCGPIHAAAKFAGTRQAGQLREDAKAIRAASLYGSECGYIATRTLVETTNAWEPHAKPVEGEYPKDPHKPAAPRNFAMRREHVIDLDAQDIDEKYERLIRVGGRYIVAVS